MFGFLATIFWILCFTINLFLMVMKRISVPNYVQWIYIPFSWGVPLILVVITGSLKQFGTQTGPSIVHCSFFHLLSLNPNVFPDHFSALLWNTEPIICEWSFLWPSCCILILRQHIVSDCFCQDFHGQSCSSVFVECTFSQL